MLTAAMGVVRNRSRPLSLSATSEGTYLLGGVGMIRTTKQSPRELRDALVYLPRKGAVEYRWNQVIYGEQHPSAGLYLVVQGRVKVSVASEDGLQTVTDISCADEFFGASALLGQTDHQERATPLKPPPVSTWT